MLNQLASDVPQLAMRSICFLMRRKEWTTNPQEFLSYVFLCNHQLVMYVECCITILTITYWTYSTGTLYLVVKACQSQLRQRFSMIFPCAILNQQVVFKEIQVHIVSTWFKCVCVFFLKTSGLGRLCRCFRSDCGTVCFCFCLTVVQHGCVCQNLWLSMRVGWTPIYQLFWCSQKGY